MMQDAKINEAQFVRLAIANPKLVHAMSQSVSYDRKLHSFIATKFISAPIFKMDSTASKAATNLSTKWFPMLVQLLPSIRLPFPAIILSLDNYAVNEALGLEGEVDKGTQRTYLLWQVRDTEVIRCAGFFVRSRREGHAQMWVEPFIWEFDPDGSKKVFIDQRFVAFIKGGLAKTLTSLTQTYGGDYATEVFVRIWFLGSLLAHDHPNHPSDQDIGSFMLSLSLHAPPWGFELHEDKNILAKQQELIGASFSDTTGEPRIVLAALAMLNLKDHIAEVGASTRPQGRQRFGIHTGPYFVERNVTVKLPEKEQHRRIRNSARENAHGWHNRRHPVKGHWCQRGGDENCPHDWEQHDTNKYECKLCQRKRYYKKAYHRGDAALGWVHRDRYNVESKTDGSEMEVKDERRVREGTPS